MFRTTAESLLSLSFKGASNQRLDREKIGITGMKLVSLNSP